MRDAPRSRGRAVRTFVALIGVLGALFAACTSYKRDNGESCIKNDDCNSGVCVQQLCTSAPPLLAGDEYPDSGSDSSASGSSSGSGSGSAAAATPARRRPTAPTTAQLPR